MKFYCIFIIVFFFNTLFVFANDENVKFRYSDDPDFDATMLKGPASSEAVVKFRNNFYSKKDFELARKQKENPGEDIAEEIAEQFENRIDFALGVDFPTEKRNSILSSLKKMHYRLEVLRKILEEKKINNEYYLSIFNSESEKYLNTCSNVLTDQEFKNLFQLEKTEINDAFRKLLEAISKK